MDEDYVYIDKRFLFDELFNEYTAQKKKKRSVMYACLMSVINHYRLIGWVIWWIVYSPLFSPRII